MDSPVQIINDPITKVAIGGRATRGPLFPSLVRDGVEVVDNPLSETIPEIFLVVLIGTMAPNVRRSLRGQLFGVQEAQKNRPFFPKVRAVDCHTLLEAELALGDVVGDGDGDGSSLFGIDNNGIRDGLVGVVEPGDLEARDRIKNESSRIRGGEIVQGRYCEGVRFTQGHQHSFQLQYSMLTVVLGGHTLAGGDDRPVSLRDPLRDNWNLWEP